MTDGVSVEKHKMNFYKTKVVVTHVEAGNLEDVLNNGLSVRSGALRGRSD